MVAIWALPWYQGYKQASLPPLSGIQTSLITPGIRNTKKPLTLGIRDTKKPLTLGIRDTIKPHYLWYQGYKQASLPLVEVR